MAFGVLRIAIFLACGISCIQCFEPQQKDLQDLVNYHRAVIRSRLGRPEPEPVHRRMFPSLDDFSYDDSNFIFPNISQQCIDDFNRSLSSLEDEWAQRMIDADGKPGSGIMDGNGVWLGDFYQCRNIVAPPINGTNSFTGKYCKLSLTIENSSNSSKLVIPLTLGLCVPSSCSEQDLLELINPNENSSSALTDRPTFKSLDSVNIKSAVAICPLEHQPWSNGAIAILCILYLFGMLAVIGTSLTIYEIVDWSCDKEDSFETESTINHMYDEIRSKESATELLIRTQKPSSIKKFLKCFCFITNGAKILSTEVRSGDLQCIHGIRFFSMTWVILGHTYAFAAISVLGGNLKHLMEIVDTVPFQTILQGTFSVDSFFLLSGFLLSYLFLKEANAKDGKINWLMFYVHRYVRLTPVYALVLAFNATLSVHLSAGPLWPNTSFDPNCKHAWWKNLLYINNFYDATTQCMSWSWYLANDMQFYVISPIILYPLWRWPKVGLSIISALMIGSWTATGLISSHYNIQSGYIGLTGDTNLTTVFTDRTNDYFDRLYTKPYTRISPYLIGIILGYLIIKHQQQKTSLPKIYLAIGWVLATFLGLGIVYGFYHSHLNTAAAATYNALSRSVFSVALAWLIYACLTGHGGVINKILSWKALIPLSRLTYCAYLVHPIILIGYYMSQNNVVEISHITMTILFLGFLVLSYATALVCSLVFESSIMGIEKLLIKKSDSS